MYGINRRGTCQNCDIAARKYLILILTSIIFLFNSDKSLLFYFVLFCFIFLLFYFFFFFFTSFFFIFIFFFFLFLFILIIYLFILLNILFWHFYVLVPISLAQILSSLFFKQTNKQTKKLFPEDHCAVKRSCALKDSLFPHAFPKLFQSSLSSIPHVPS